jgi:hypothetical protein
MEWLQAARGPLYVYLSLKHVVLHGINLSGKEDRVYWLYRARITQYQVCCFL